MKTIKVIDALITYDHITPHPSKVGFADYLDANYVLTPKEEGDKAPVFIAFTESGVCVDGKDYIRAKNPSEFKPEAKKECEHWSSSFLGGMPFRLHLDNECVPPEPKKIEKVEDLTFNLVSDVGGNEKWVGSEEAVKELRSKINELIDFCNSLTQPK